MSSSDQNANSNFVAEEEKANREQKQTEQDNEAITQELGTVNDAVVVGNESELEPQVQSREEAKQ